MIKSFFDQFAKFSPLLLAVFYLQGVFFYSGILYPYKISRDLYPINFHESFTWTASFYLLDGQWLVITLATILVLPPFVTAALKTVNQYFEEKTQHIKLNPPRLVRIYISYTNEKKSYFSVLLLLFWLGVIFLVFSVPYNSGKAFSQSSLIKDKCMMTDANGEFHFQGTKTVYFNPEAGVKNNKLENTYIVHRNSNFITLYDGSEITNYRAELVLKDSFNSELFEEKKISEKEKDCKAKASLAVK